MKKFGRLLTAMVTPFTGDGKVDYPQAKRLAKALLDSGSDGVVVAGTTGECPTLTNQEKLRLFAEVKSVIADKGSVIAGTGNNDTADSLEMTREAKKTGVDGCLLIVPYYNKPTQEGIYQHFKAIAESTDLPCILYNVPSRTVTNLNAETMIRLSKLKNIVGVKEASANFDQINAIINGVDEQFMVYSGNDGDTLNIMTAGGYGVISVVSHIVGLQFKQMIDDIVSGKIKEATEIHEHIMPLTNALFVISNPMPVKYALNYIGFPVGKPRLPLIEPDDKSRTVIEQTLKNYTIDLPVSSQT